ncbi:MAG: hypothetical protein HC767_05050 [Akkermansiaceae bacterium]|nr:hypothetical protein [Akkermansiaceae bacterium]
MAAKKFASDLSAAEGGSQLNLRSVAVMGLQLMPQGCEKHDIKSLCIRKFSPFASEC